MSLVMAEPIQRRREATSGRVRPLDLSRLSDAYLDCRELGHTWGHPAYGTVEPVSVSSTRARRLANRGTLGRRALECGRCTCTREDFVSRSSGELIARRYHYPEGYLIKGSGRPRANAMRVERFDRALGALKEAMRR